MVAKSPSITPAPEPKFHRDQTLFKIGAPPVVQKSGSSSTPNLVASANQDAAAAVSRSATPRF